MEGDNSFSCHPLYTVDPDCDCCELREKRVRHRKSLRVHVPTLPPIFEYLELGEIEEMSQYIEREEIKCLETLCSLGEAHFLLFIAPNSSPDENACNQVTAVDYQLPASNGVCSNQLSSHYNEATIIQLPPPPPYREANRNPLPPPYNQAARNLLPPPYDRTAENQLPPPPPPYNEADRNQVTPPRHCTGAIRKQLSHHNYERPSIDQLSPAYNKVATSQELSAENRGTKKQLPPPPPYNVAARNHLPPPTTPPQPCSGATRKPLPPPNDNRAAINQLSPAYKKEATRTQLSDYNIATRNKLPPPPPYNEASRNHLPPSPQTCSGATRKESPPPIYNRAAINQFSPAYKKETTRTQLSDYNIGTKKQLPPPPPYNEAARNRLPPPQTCGGATRKPLPNFNRADINQFSPAYKKETTRTQLSDYNIATKNKLPPPPPYNEASRNHLPPSPQTCSGATRKESPPPIYNRAAINQFSPAYKKETTRTQLSDYNIGTKKQLPPPPPYNEAARNRLPPPQTCGGATRKPPPNFNRSAINQFSPAYKKETTRTQLSEYNIGTKKQLPPPPPYNEAARNHLPPTPPPPPQTCGGATRKPLLPPNFNRAAIKQFSPAYKKETTRTQLSDYNIGTKKQLPPPPPYNEAARDHLPPPPPPYTGANTKQLAPPNDNRAAQLSTAHNKVPTSKQFYANNKMASNYLPAYNVMNSNKLPAGNGIARNDLSPANEFVGCEQLTGSETQEGSKSEKRRRRKVVRTISF